MNTARGWRLAALVAAGGVVAAAAGDLFRDTLARLAVLARAEEYSYLIPLFFTLAVLFYVSILGSVVGARPTVGRFLAVSLYSSVSATFYVLADLDPEFAIQYRAAALALLSAAITLAVIQPRKLHHLIPVVALALLIPPPISWISEAARQLAPLIAQLASAMTGAHYVSANGRVLILIDSPQGRVSLEIARACTGIVSSSSIIAVAPLLVYYAAASRAPARRKLMATILSLTTALLVSFVGNLARIVMMVRAAEESGLDAALRTFHSTPAPLYAAIAVVASFAVLKRLAGSVEILPDNGPEIHVDRAMVGFLLVSIILIAYSIAVSSPHSQKTNTEMLSLPEIMVDPASLVAEANGARLLNAVDRQDLRWLLGSSKVVLFRVEYDGVLLTGYVEVADSIARFHAWHLCLEAQGYNVREIWPMGTGDFKVYQVRYSSGVRDRIILYTIIPVEADVGGGTVTVYLRISVSITASQADEYRAALDFLSKAYEGLARNPQEPDRGESMLDRLVILDYSLVAASLGYACANLAVIVYNRLKSREPYRPRVPR